MRFAHVGRALAAGAMAAFVLLPSLRPATAAQPQKPSTAAETPCDEQRAVALVRQQAEEAKSFEASAGQIGVLVRAADLLWPRDEEAARGFFAAAFDLATRYYRQRGYERQDEGRISIVLPDQRFEVMRAVGRRDAAWARRLAEQTVEEAARESEGAKAAPASPLQEVSGKLVNLALELLDVDRAAALAVARNSFRHPAGLYLPTLFYKLAEADRAAADQLFRDALASYSSAGTTHDLSYLSIYAYGISEPVSRVRAHTHYDLPQGFKPDPELIELFTRALLARAELVMKTPDQFSADGDAQQWETTQVYTALVQLERLAQERAPHLRERIAGARARAESAFGERARAAAEGYLRPGDTVGRLDTFEKMMDSAESAATPERRDGQTANAIHAAKTLEHLARLEQLAEKVSDPQVRRQLLMWLHARRAQLLAKEGLFDEARRSADRVGDLDLRSVIYFEIARESIKRLEDKTRARELLDAVASAANSAPNTAIKARTQLGVAHLLADFDALRSLEVLADAVKTVNALDNPDLDTSFIIQRIEGKDFRTYGAISVPGFKLDNSFREAGARDFDGALLAARNLSDRVLRATAVVGLASRCLERPAQPKQQQPQPKKPADKPRPEGRAKP